MRETLIVKFVKLSGDAILPEYKSDEAAGMDMYAAEDLELQPNQTALVSTGIAMSMPPGYEAQIRSRSGLAAKHGICVLNAPGTIDSDYRGEVKVILHNHSDKRFDVSKGDRVAQMVISKLPQVRPVVVHELGELGETDRGQGGFGSTGI